MIILCSVPCEVVEGKMYSSRSDRRVDARQPKRRGPPPRSAFHATCCCVICVIVDRDSDQRRHPAPRGICPLVMHSTTYRVIRTRYWRWRGKRHARTDSRSGRSVPATNRRCLSQRCRGCGMTVSCVGSSPAWGQCCR